MNLMEAFKALDKLDEEVFSVNDDGIKKLQNFINSDDSVDELDVYDLDVDDEENSSEECHVGDAILDCCVCHSKVFKPVSEIVVDEETQVANVGDECPYCYSVDGYKVVGEVKPMGEDDESSDEVEISDTEVTEDIDQVDISTDDVDIEIEDKDSDTEEETVEEKSEEIIKESKRGKWRNSTLLKESIDFSIPGFNYFTTDTFEDDGHTGHNIVYSKDGVDIVEVEVWEDNDSPVIVNDNLYAPNFMNRVYNSFNDFASDLEYKSRRIHESVDLSTKKNTIAALLKDNMSELASIIDVNELRERIIELVDNSDIAGKPAAQKLKRDLYSKKSAGALLSTIATYMTGDKVIKTGKYKKAANESVKARKIRNRTVKESSDITLEAKYEIYPDGRITSTRVTGNDEFDAFANLLDEVGSYVTSDDVLDMQDEGATIEDVVKQIQSMNGDGSDFIFSIKNITTGKKYFDLDESCKRKSIKESDSNEETIGDKLKKYQMWVDYDMEHYGKVSETTQDIIDKEGLQLIKDQYGDYEVSVGHYKAESCRRKNRKSIKESKTKGTFITNKDYFYDIVNNYYPDDYEEDAELINFFKSNGWVKGNKMIIPAGTKFTYTGDMGSFSFFDVVTSKGTYNLPINKNYFNEFEDVVESFNEDVDEIEIKADDVKISIEAEDETCEDCKDEVVTPVSEETMEEIDIENIDKDSVDEVTEECLKENYNNVKFFRSNNIKKRNNKFIVEGVIGFKSGKKKNTKFIFESNKTNRNKVTFSGKNSDLSLRKNNLLLTGKVVGKNLISESLKLK